MKMIAKLMTVLALATVFIYASHSDITACNNSLESHQNGDTKIISHNNRYVLDRIDLHSEGVIIVPFDYCAHNLLCITCAEDLKPMSVISVSTNKYANSAIIWKYHLEEVDNDYYELIADWESNKLYSCHSDILECININNGKLSWSTHIEYPIQTGTNMLIIDDNLFISSELHLMCLDKRTGIQKWKTRYQNFTGDPNNSARIITDGRSIFARKGTWVYRIELNTGKIIWDYHYIFDISTTYELAVYENYIFFPYDVATVFLDKETGEVIKILEMIKGDRIIVTRVNPVIVNGYMYVACNNTLIKMNSKLETVWDIELLYDKGQENRYFIAKDGKLFVLSFSSKLYVLSAETSWIHQRLDIGCNYGWVSTDETDCIYYGTIRGMYCLSPASDSVTYTINSNTYNPDNDEPREMDSEPIIKNGRTLLPARYVIEPLGGQVFWDGDERKVTCKLVAPDNAETDEYKENIVELWIDKPMAKVNGSVIPIDPDNPDVVPTIINDRTMVPMRFLAESLGCEVEWIPDTKEIILTYGQGG